MHKGCLSKVKVAAGSVIHEEYHTNEISQEENASDIKSTAKIGIEKQTVADCFRIIRVSTIKVHGKPFSDRRSIGKRKIETVKRRLQNLLIFH